MMIEEKIENKDGNPSVTLINIFLDGVEKAALERKSLEYVFDVNGGNTVKVIIEPYSEPQ